MACRRAPCWQRLRPAAAGWGESKPPGGGWESALRAGTGGGRWAAQAGPWPATRDTGRVCVGTAPTPHPALPAVPTQPHTRCRPWPAPPRPPSPPAAWARPAAAALLATALRRRAPKRRTTPCRPPFPRLVGVEMVGVGGVGGNGRACAACTAPAPMPPEARCSDLCPTTRRTQKIINAITVFLNNSPLNEGVWASGGGR